MSGGYHDLVVKRNGIDVQVVPADVQWVKAKGSLVYGLIKEYQYTDGVSSKAGYFVLDTQTWKLIDGLAENEVSKYLGTEMQKGS